MISDMELARGQAVEDIAAALCRAAGDAIATHGSNDPNAPVMLTAGFWLAIDRITREIDPTFKIRLLIQLEGR